MKSWKSSHRIFPLFLLLGLVGCGKFFVPENNPTPPPSGSGSFLYVANGTAQSVTGFSIGTSSLANISNSPYTLGVAPSAIAITPSGKYVYVSTLAGAIYGYLVEGSGVLTLLNNGNALITGVSPTALRVDPSGLWLVAADPTPQAWVFSINTTTGFLTQQGNPLALDPGSPFRVVFTPSNGVVYISLATGGVDICTFNATSGALTKTNMILKPKAVGYSDQGLAIDPAGAYLFVAEIGASAVRVLSIATTGALTEVSGSPFKAGVGPNAVVVDSTGSYVYVANRGDGTISAYSLAASTGVLTTISGSPFTTGTGPVDVEEDASDKYLAVTCIGGTPDLEVFTIDSATATTPGGLTTFAKAMASTPSGALGVVAAD